MNLSAPAQLTDVQRAVQEHFQRGGSMLTVLILLGTLAGIILMVHLLTRRQERRRGVATANDPMGLYRELLAELHLTPWQRKLLLRVAREARLDHPTVLLLSPQLFSRYIETGSSGRHPAITRSDLQPIAQLKETLFPPG